jgi:hypothetical protein
LRTTDRAFCCAGIQGSVSPVPKVIKDKQFIDYSKASSAFLSAGAADE